MVEEALDQLKAAQQDSYVQSTQNVIDELEVALRQPLVIGSVCGGCGSKFDAMDIKVGVCYCCQKEIKQTDL